MKTYYRFSYISPTASYRLVLFDKRCYKFVIIKKSMNSLSKIFKFRSALKKRQVRLGFDGGTVQMRSQLMRMTNMNQGIVSTKKEASLTLA